MAKKRNRQTQQNAQDALEPHDASKVTAMKLAQILIVSEQELVRLTRAGILTREIEKRNGRDRIIYDKDASVEAYIRHLREPEMRAREEFLKEKRDTARIIREHKELDLDFARGNMLKVDDVEIAIMNVLSIVKNQVLTLPVRLTRLLVGQSDPTKIRNLLKTHCTLCLRAAENFTLEKTTKASRNGHNAENDATRKRKQRVDSRLRRR
jgi:hypothetical protein